MTQVREIQTKYYSFFETVNKSIDMYLDIKESSAGNWVNVTVKENTDLPPEIVHEINKRFVII
jgi:hypothetical protein